MRYLILGTLLATASAGPALAQEAAADSPFTGPHVEVLAGYDNLGGTDNGRDGLLYGIGAGYDFQLGGAVAGERRGDLQFDRNVGRQVDTSRCLA